jgi:hypothetical protein
MNILSYNPGHDGAIAYIERWSLGVFCRSREELELPLLARHPPADVCSTHSGELDEIPDVIMYGRLVAT